MCSFVYRLCLYLSLSSIVAGVPTYLPFDPDTYLPTNKIIERHGYHAESHDVTTSDGYILTLHRIPAQPNKESNGTTTKTKPPVFLQHGILASSADWIISGPQKSLPYMLADRGHDVWMGNARGNTYSRAHVKLSPDDNTFWDFTFHEMGTLDLPAVIDYILNKTGEHKLYYIGHSMGTTMFYVLCSEKPEYNDKIITMFSLAPVGFLKNAQSPVRYFAPYSKDLSTLLNWFGEGEFLPHNTFIKTFFKYACELSATEAKFCESNLFVICGHDPAQFNKTLLPVLLGHTPAGASAKTLVHFAQEINSGDFRQFDYDKNNPCKYNGSTEPPSYNLSKIAAPIFLLFGANDYLANIKDVRQLIVSLPNVVHATEVQYPMFNHLDFLLGIDVNIYVNIPVLNAIDTIEKTGFHPKQPYSLDSFAPRSDEPVFKDISSMFRYKLKMLSQSYINRALEMKSKAESDFISYKENTKRMLKRKIDRLQKMLKKNLKSLGLMNNNDSVNEIDDDGSFNGLKQDYINGQKFVEVNEII